MRRPQRRTPLCQKRPHFAYEFLDGLGSNVGNGNIVRFLAKYGILIFGHDYSFLCSHAKTIAESVQYRYESVRDDKSWYTYVLRSLKDGETYTGSTNNLRKRCKQHSDGLTRSTKGRRPLKIDILRNVQERG